MDIDLSHYTKDPLVDLNRRVVERIRFLRQTRCYQDMARFSVGDSVSFTPECGHVVVGTVVRLNKKSVTVVGKDGHHWRVAPSFLSKVEDAELGATETNPKGQVLSLAGASAGRRER